jgi:ribosome modulation factor
MIEEFRAYQAGALAQENGTCDNPHQAHSPLHAQWMRGWLDGTAKQSGSGIPAADPKKEPA